MILLRSLFILLLTTLLLYCTKSPEDMSVSEVNKNTTGSNASSISKSVGIGPLIATVQSVITLNADSTLLNNSKIYWYVNGKLDTNSSGRSFTSDNLKKADVIQAIVLNKDRKHLSNKITLLNTPPGISKARLQPTIPRVISTLTVELSTNDVDDDIIRFKYKWRVNDKLISEQSFIESEFKRDDSISVEVTPFDEDADGRSVKLTGRISNTLPEFMESKPSFDGKTFECPITAYDPDGDVLTYSLKQGPEGMYIDPASGFIRWEVPETLESIYDIEVSISDDHDGKIIVPLRTRIGFREE